MRRTTRHARPLVRPASTSSSASQTRFDGEPLRGLFSITRSTDTSHPRVTKHSPMPSRRSFGASYRVSTRSELPKVLALPLRACSADARHPSRLGGNSLEGVGDYRHVEAPAMRGLGVGSHRAGVLSAAERTTSGI